MSLIENLIDIALANKKNSYSPYSKFRVSAVVRTEDGEIFKGVNIENASYPVGICAERSALAAAISTGKRSFSHIVIVGDSSYTYPCGMCRQFIGEFANESTKLVIAKDKYDYKLYSIKELLPQGFSKEDLK